MTHQTKPLNHEDGLTIRLTIQAQPDPLVPANSRLRRLLKMLLRSYGMKCLRVEELPTGKSGGDTGNQTNDPSKETR